MKTKKYDVIVIGAGAAGCVAAGYAAQRGKKVLILEKNQRPARKILVTGKGRCNLTNNCDGAEFMKHVRSNPKFMFSAISKFAPQSTMELFERLGVALKTERGRRVFPVSDRAMDIADALQLFIRNDNIEIINRKAARILSMEGSVTGVMDGEGTCYEADRVILSTGGLSYPATGSTGDGYAMAADLGHTIIDTRASLVGIYTKEDISGASGLSLKNVELTLTAKNRKKPLYKELGEMLITDKGVSGPLVLSASSYMDGDIGDYCLSIDFKPGLSADELDVRILRDFAEKANRDFSNALDALLPRSIIPYIVDRSGIDGEMKVNQVTREMRADLVRTVKKFELTPRALEDVETAVVTAGGVDVSEVDPKTMESKIVKGLFFAGEVLDLDAETGGYNLQIAFSTGHAAGTSV